ncbi:MAG TPA: pantetheine-phosphate adenylyltransferase [Lactobacillaceae bacterium]|jgi:pantetheine-phosphate adenylyltransferase
MSKAVFAGSFDPLTNGHLDIIERASALFDEVVVGVGTNLSKAPLFQPDEKIALIETAIAHLPNIKVQTMSGLTVNFMKEIDAQYLVRGLRNTTDYEYERDIATMNFSLAGVETVLLMAKPENQNISSSMLKEVAKFGADISRLVPANIASALKERLYEK